MSEQKQHMDTVEQARKLLSDGDENYKLHTVIWLYQQSEKVAELSKENERLKDELSLSGINVHQRSTSELIDKQAKRIEELETLLHKFLKESMGGNVLITDETYNEIKAALNL